MLAVNTGTWIAIALLAPFWWGMGLLVLALLGDLAPSWRGPIQRLFDRLERIPPGTPARRRWQDAA